MDNIGTRHRNRHQRATAVMVAANCALAVAAGPVTGAADAATAVRTKYPLAVTNCGLGDGCRFRGARHERGDPGASGGVGAAAIHLVEDLGPPL